MIAIVTDSASMMPASLRDRFGVEIAPLAVLIDGVVHHEGVDLTSAEFYARLDSGAAVSTSSPSPGDVLAVYERAAAAGATEILSIHTGSNYSATFASASVAAGLSSVPVRLVDTGTASFPVTMCVWAAAEVVAAGGSITAALDAATATAAQTGSVFVVGLPDLARRGGRFGAVGGELTTTEVIEMGPAGFSELARVTDLDAALDVMVAHVAAQASGRVLRAAVGDADRPALTEALLERLAAEADLFDLVRYEIGPSIGAHSGPGTVGIVYSPVLVPAAG